MLKEVKEEEEKKEEKEASKSSRLVDGSVHRPFCPPTDCVVSHQSVLRVWLIYLSHELINTSAFFNFLFVVPPVHQLLLNMVVCHLYWHLIG